MSDSNVSNNAVWNSARELIYVAVEGCIQMAFNQNSGKRTFGTMSYFSKNRITYLIRRIVWASGSLNVLQTHVWLNSIPVPVIFQIND